MAEIRSLRGMSATLLKGLSTRQRSLESDTPENLQGQPIDLSPSNADEQSMFGTQQIEEDDGQEDQKIMIYLAIVAIVAALLLVMCVVAVFLIRSTLRKEVLVKGNVPVDATYSLPQESACSVNDSAASRSTATGERSVLRIPLPASLKMASGKERRMPKDFSVAALQEKTVPPRTPLEMPPETIKETIVVKHNEVDDLPDEPRTYSPSMRLLLEQVETLSSNPGQILPISVQKDATSYQRDEIVNLTEL